MPEDVPTSVETLRARTRASIDQGPIAETDGSGARLNWTSDAE
jgi:hypothetical protein